MLKNLNFKHKILALPALAATAFVALIITNALLGQRNSTLLREVKNGYVPALLLSRDLEETLEKIQRGLQDAVAAAEMESLEEADTLRDLFLQHVAQAKEVEVGQEADTDALVSVFRRYYQLARETSRRMISEEEGEDLLGALATMQTLYLQAKESLEAATARDRKRMGAAFVEVERTTEASMRLNILIATIFLLTLSVLSFWIVRGLVGSLTSTVQHLGAAAGQALAIAKQAESNSADEAAAVDQTKRTMASLLEAANEISESAKVVLSTAEQAAAASTTIADRISNLNGQALKIGDVLATIQTIADKSDILALNASLEGVKAGDAGRGFVVVGEEMRRLAEMVLGAIRQIKHLTSEIRQLSQAAILAATEGQKLSVETAEASRRISMITGQQRSGTEQVSLSMSEIQAFTQQALSGAQQTKATADDLVRISREIGQLLGGTVVEPGGEASG